MAEVLDYCRAEGPGGDRRSPGPGAAVVLGVLAGICFALPFGLFQLSQWLYPNDQTRIALVLVVPVMLLWLSSGILGFLGVIAGVRVLRRGRPGLWTIASMSICAVILLIVAVHVARGILQYLRLSQ